MGLGTGYLVYGPQELFGYPARNDSVDFATGVWGIAVVLNFVLNYALPL
jgi:hypothetical protein